MSGYHVQDALKYFGEDLMSLVGPLTISFRTDLYHGSYPPLLVHFFWDYPTLKAPKSVLAPYTLTYPYIHPFLAPSPQKALSLSVASSIPRAPAGVLLCHSCLSLIALSDHSNPYFSGLAQEWHPPRGPPRPPLVKQSLAP